MLCSGDRAAELADFILGYPRRRGFPGATIRSWSIASVNEIAWCYLRDCLLGVGRRALAARRAMGDSRQRGTRPSRAPPAPQEEAAQSRLLGRERARFRGAGRCNLPAVRCVPHSALAALECAVQFRVRLPDLLDHGTPVGGHSLHQRRGRLWPPLCVSGQHAQSRSSSSYLGVTSNYLRYLRI